MSAELIAGLIRQIEDLQDQESPARKTVQIHPAVPFFVLIMDYKPGNQLSEGNLPKAIYEKAETASTKRKLLMSAENADLAAKWAELEAATLRELARVLLS